MKQKINVIFISVIAIVLLVIGFVFAINNRKANLNFFYDNGYIISDSYKSGTDQINKLYFGAQTSYTSSKENTITFTNTDGDKVKVDEESFVHYTNGDIMSLKKGVAIDLDDIDSKLIRYYNIFEGSVLNKKGNMYQINNLGKTLDFSKLMFKISNNKYLIAADSIVASFSDNQTVEFKKYVEIEYDNENVIKVYNEEANYRTISSNLFLIIDNIKIDLGYKTISKNNVEYLTMADMIINSNDNIEVLPEKEVIKEPKPENGNDVPNNPGQGNTNNENTENIEGGFENLITPLPDGNEQVDKDDEFAQPTFKVDSLDVTTLGFENLQLSYEDTSAVLYGDRVVEILENSTGKAIGSFEVWDEGTLNYNVNSYFGLKPNTEYTLNVSGQYKIKDTIYDRTFISKIFRTLDIGLDIVDDYVTSDSLSFAVYKNTYSEVTAFSYDIKDKDGNVIAENSDGISFGSLDVVVFDVEDKFKPNTEYTLTIKDIVYGSDKFPTDVYKELKLKHKTKTLKQKPFDKEISLNASINKQKDSVVFSLDGINDIHGGIVNYTYNIYDENNELIKTVSNDAKESLSIARKDLDANSVNYNVVISFDDNEKTMMYTSQVSEPLALTDIVYPKVIEYVSVEDEIDHEKLIGYISVDDKEDFIKYNNISTYKVVVKEKNENSLLGDVAEIYVDYLKKEDGKIQLPINIDKLIPETTYVLYVYLENENKSLYLGYAMANTGEVEPIKLTIESLEEQELFGFGITLTEGIESYSSRHLSYLDFKLYGCHGLEQPLESCTKLSYEATLPKNQNTQELYDIFKNGSLDVAAGDFNFAIENYDPNYGVYKVGITGYSSNYEIPINVNNTETNAYVIEFNPIPPKLEIKTEPIYKDSESAEEALKDHPDNYSEQLDEDTVIGYKFNVETSKNPMGVGISKIYYSLLKAIDGTCTEEVVYGPIEQTVASDKNFDIIINDKILSRGNSYCLKYYGEYVDNDNESDLLSANAKDYLNPLSQTAKVYTTLPVTMEPFVINKQPADVKGFLIGYNFDLTEPSKYEMNFKLSIKDLDEALIKQGVNDNSIVYLYNTTTQQVVLPNADENYDKKSDVYAFDVIPENNYKLMINEKILDNNVEYDLYSVTPETIYNLEDNVVFTPDGITTAGKVSITFTGDNVNRISGIEIYSDEEKKYHYYEAIKQNETSMKVELNLRDIKTKKLGTISNKKLTFNRINLIYDSGAMINYEENDFMFIKKRDDGFKYYDLKTKSFVEKINLNYESVKNYIEQRNEYKKDVGLRLPSDMDPFKSNLLINQAAKNQINIPSFDVNDVLSTTKIETTYTVSGAIVEFELDTVNTNQQFNIILKNNNIQDSSVSYTMNSGSSNSIGNKIKSITNDGNKIKIEFDNFDEVSNYTYSVSYLDSDDELYVYNEETQESIINVSIDCLKNLPSSKEKAQYETDEFWKWNNDYSDLTFKKQITYTFDIDHAKYSLSNGEKITYVINLENNGNKVKLTEEEIKTTKAKYEGVIDLVDKNLNGAYYVYLDAYITNSSGKVRDLNSILLNDNTITLNTTTPSVNVVNRNNKPIFSYSMSDEFGLLEPFKDNSFMSGFENHEMLILNNLPDFTKQTTDYLSLKTEKPKGVKAVYFVLYQLDGENEKFIAYLPIPFVNNTLTIDLSPYFTLNDLGSGDYRVKLYYTVGNELKTITKDISIWNAERLNVQVLDVVDSYLLMLNNPEENLKDRVDKIVYQYKLSNGDVVYKELTRFEYTAVQNSDSSTTYFLGLSTGNVLTSTLTNLVLQFYAGEELVYTYSRN